MGAQDRCRGCGPGLEWKVWTKELMDRKKSDIKKIVTKI